MDMKSKISIALFLAVIFAAAGWKYYRIIVVRDFVINTRIACDPSEHACFTVACDTESGEDCTNKAYAKLKKTATHLPVCNKFKEECPELTCSSNEDGCAITYCSEAVLEEGERCVSQIPAPLSMQDSSAGAPSYENEI